MVKHTHKAGEPLIGMPEEILVRYKGEYWIADSAGEIYITEKPVITEESEFDWYDLTELGE